MPTAENPAFVRNLANRLWFVMFGRGLVNPLDQIHAANPPTNSAVLDLLCEEIVARRFDIKSLLRELALTEAYQRSGLVPEGSEPVPSESYRFAREKRLSAEQLLHSLLVATGPRVRVAEAPAADQEKLRAAFVKAFGNVPQDPEIDFSPSLKSALFVMNDPLVLDCLTPRPEYLIARLSQQTDAAALADELYRCVLIRMPTEEERAMVVEYLAAIQFVGSRPSRIWCGHYLPRRSFV